MKTIRQNLVDLCGKPVCVWVGYAEHHGVVKEIVDSPLVGLWPWKLTSGGEAYLDCDGTTPTRVVVDAITALKEEGIVVSPTKKAAKKRETT